MRMKFYWGILLCLILFGCTKTTDIMKTRVIIIDECEYIIVNRNQRGSNYADMLAHKGNCKFCKERRKIEVKECIEEVLKES